LFLQEKQNSNNTPISYTNPSISSLKSPNQIKHNNNQKTINKNEMLDNVADDIRNFYENLISKKDGKINDLQNELSDIKNILKSRTEQANENIKKMAKINMSLKNEVDIIKKRNDKLESDLRKTQNEYIKVTDIDDFYQKLRKEKNELLYENNNLKNKIDNLNNVINNNIISPHKDINKDNRNEYINDRYSNQNINDNDIASSIRFKSPNINKKELNI